MRPGLTSPKIRIDVEAGLQLGFGVEPNPVRKWRMRPASVCDRLARSQAACGSHCPSSSFSGCSDGPSRRWMVSTSQLCNVCSISSFVRRWKVAPVSDCGYPVVDDLFPRECRREATLGKPLIDLLLGLYSLAQRSFSDRSHEFADCVFASITKAGGSHIRRMVGAPSAIFGLGVRVSSVNAAFPGQS